ncbi:MAG: hypothetical protein OXL40_06775 [Bacteroidota bacterium]|nr:hypothetical protein [Bacteroidota bacterium]
MYSTGLRFYLRWEIAPNDTSGVLGIGLGGLQYSVTSDQTSVVSIDQWMMLDR